MSFITAPVMALAGAATSAFGSILGGEGQAGAAEFNAAVARQNAAVAQQQGQAAIEAQQRDYARKMGSMVASYGASGVEVDSGSPLEAVADSARMATLDSLTLKYNADLRAAGYQNTAMMEDMKAKTARTSAMLNAGSNLMTGYGKYLGMTGTAIPGIGYGEAGTAAGTAMVSDGTGMLVAAL